MADQATQKAESLLREEFNQAWQHYRHNEIMRTTYLNYALSVTLGAVALSVPAAAFVKDKVLLALSATVFLLLYMILMCFVSATIFKIRHVNAHYARVWVGIRGYFYLPAKHFPFSATDLDIWRPENKTIGHPLLSIQRWAEFLLLTLQTVAAFIVGVLFCQMLFWQGVRWVAILADRSERAVRESMSGLDLRLS